MESMIILKISAWNTALSRKEEYVNEFALASSNGTNKYYFILFPLTYYVPWYIVFSWVSWVLEHKSVKMKNLDIRKFTPVYFNKTTLA